MKLPEAAHTSQPWRIHEIASDFDVLDVWALPTPGGADDFPLLVEGLAEMDPARSSSALTRFLFALRDRLGRVFGWDDEGGGLGARVASLSDRLPPDLSGSAPAASGAIPFVPVFQTRDEYAAEIANRTVHGIIHLGWVADAGAQPGGHRGQMAVLVKRNGLLGAAYLAAIAPFRHLIVYPALLRDIGREWEARRVSRTAGGGTDAA